MLPMSAYGIAIPLARREYARPGTRGPLNGRGVGDVEGERREGLGGREGGEGMANTAMLGSMNGSTELRVRFSVQDEELSDLHARAFGNPRGEVTPWASRLNQHSLTWIGAFASEALIASPAGSEPVPCLAEATALVPGSTTVSSQALRAGSVQQAGRGRGAEWLAQLRGLLADPVRRAASELMPRTTAVDRLDVLLGGPIRAPLRRSSCDGVPGA